MHGLGTIVNVAAIVVGGLAGLLGGRRIPERLQKTLMSAMGVSVLFVGVSGALSQMLRAEGGALTVQGTMMMILSLAVGAVLGELLDLEDRMERFGAWLKVKTKSESDGGFIGAFVTASLTVCIGAMAIVGSIQDGILGDHATLFAKAVLDLVIIMVMTASMGKGCHPGRHPAGQRDAAGKAPAAGLHRCGAQQPVAGRLRAGVLRGAESGLGQKDPRGKSAAVAAHSRHMGVFVTINYKGVCNMVSEKMVAWGSQGCVIRDLAAYGEQRAAVVGAENVFNFTIGNPSVPAPSCVRQTIEHLLQTVPAEQLHAYTAAPGLASVRAKMAAYLEKTFGVGYRAEDVYMTSGASSALAMLAYALLSPGDEVLTLSPYFSEYKLYAEAAGGTLTAVPSNPEDFQIDLDAFSAAISEKTAVVLLNSPNNPSGVILSRRSITKLAELLEKKSAEYGHRIYIVADEPYRELAYDGEEVPFIPAIYKDTIYCYSFSKTLSLPGERIGFLAIHPELTDYARVRAAIYGAGRALGYINASTMFQLVAAECVGQTADISVYKQNRDLIHTALLDMGYTCVKPSGAFYLFLKTPEPDATAFCKKAMALDLLVVPGDEFGCPGYVRLAYCVPKTMLERSLPRFRQLADQYGLKK